MTNSSKIHWGRVLLGGFLAELFVFAIVFPVLHFFGQRAFLGAILVASFLMPFLFAIWVGRRIQSLFLLHGALVGVVGALIYVALTRGHPEPLLYVVAHGLKVLGGLAGGFVASRRGISEG